MERFGEWFAIETGKLTGVPVLAGWRDRPVAGGQTWVSLSECPRCFTLVHADGKRGHEQWHGVTDHPIPPGVLIEGARLARERRA